MIARYLSLRGDKRVHEYGGCTQRTPNGAMRHVAVGAQNFAAANQQDTRATNGIDRVKMHTLFRYAMLKVMRENHIDVFVQPNITIPPGEDRCGSGTHGRRARRERLRDHRPAGRAGDHRAGGFNDVVYEPQNVLSDDKKSYTQKAGTVATKLSMPLPFSLEFWAGPGMSAVALKVASAYEAATHHRRPPAAFSSLKSEAWTTSRGAGGECWGGDAVRFPRCTSPTSTIVLARQHFRDERRVPLPCVCRMPDEVFTEEFTNGRRTPLSLAHERSRTSGL